MVEIVCLVVILMACALSRVLGALLKALRVEPMEAMLYLGLAEYTALPPGDERFS